MYMFNRITLGQIILQLKLHKLCFFGIFIIQRKARYRKARSVKPSSENNGYTIKQLIECSRSIFRQMLENDLGCPGFVPPHVPEIYEIILKIC